MTDTIAAIMERRRKKILIAHHCCTRCEIKFDPEFPQVDGQTICAECAADLVLRNGRIEIGDLIADGGHWIQAQPAIAADRRHYARTWKRKIIPSRQPRRRHRAL